LARLTKDAWAKPSLKTEEVEVEELGGSVLVRELPAEYSAEVASHFEMRTVGRDQVAKVDTATMERLQFVYGVVDENGEQMFSEDEVRVLARNHGSAFKTVIAAIDRLSGTDKEAIENTSKVFPASGTDEGGPVLVNGGPPGDSGPDVPVRASGEAGDDRAGDDDGPSGDVGA
jgi:hypothetical protein